MDKNDLLTGVMTRHLDGAETCHGFEIQVSRVELHIRDGYRYYERYISLEDFHKSMDKYFND